ncbi:uncharacterized protein LOC124465508 isoform X2 [Hypomesus transpacificus]|uniref:uncharacterized protein LOC124465508 isoform X2 n=1 Tax=Hypomesus transpacificus TaxID=137520 RepID=UPI001F07A582|nr:uncharacterized protein LOC124465508 isoform X2 [Hypomesus transpacificus]
MELEDELKSVDTFLEHLKTEETEKNRQKTKTASPKPVHWKKRDHNGDIVHQRPQALRKQSTSQRPDEGRHVSSSPPLDHGQHLDHDLNMRQLEDLLQDSENMESQDFVQQPPLSSWSQRQKEVQQCWQQANHHGWIFQIHPTNRVCDTGKYSICEQDCFLPTALPQRIWSCDTADAAVSVGRSIILVCINGRYDLHVPVLTCKHCNQKWAPEVSDFVKSGYWPATMQAQTLFHQDLFHSFEAMKTAAPGMSRQAFTAMLDQSTKQYGRTGKVNADAFQRSFLQFVYCNYEENQLLGKEPLVCPACSPEMVAVSVDGNRKLYRFQKTNHP